MPKRHSLIGCKFNASAKYWAARYVKRFVGVGNYPGTGNLQYQRHRDIVDCLGYVALHHFGYKVPVPPEEFLNRGVDVVVHYFCDDWWRGDKPSTQAMDKSRKRRDLVWFQEFSRGLLLGLLSERWQDVARVCAWVEADLRPEYMGGEIEDELVHVYRSVAAGLRPEPMPGLEKVEAKILKCRLMRPRLLFQAWDAARRKDQAAFSEALLKSLEHYVANEGPPEYRPTPAHWIATHQSVVALAARRLGMTLPELPPKLEAVLITRESLGLSPFGKRRPGQGRASLHKTGSTGTGRKRKPGPG